MGKSGRYNEQELSSESAHRPLPFVHSLNTNWENVHICKSLNSQLTRRSGILEALAQAKEHIGYTNVQKFTLPKIPSFNSHSTFFSPPRFVLLIQTIICLAKSIINCKSFSSDHTKNMLYQKPSKRFCYNIHVQY